MIGVVLISQPMGYIEYLSSSGNTWALFMLMRYMEAKAEIMEQIYNEV